MNIAIVCLENMKMNNDMPEISIERALGVKCPRCWKYHTVADNFMDLCDACGITICKDYPEHEAVPHIKAAYRAQRDKYLAK